MAQMKIPRNSPLKASLNVMLFCYYCMWQSRNLQVQQVVPLKAACDRRVGMSERHVFPPYIRFGIYSLIQSLHAGTVTSVNSLKPTLCVNLQNQNTPLALHKGGGRGGREKTLTFSAQTHGLSIFPEVFETFLRFSTWREKNGAIRHTDKA